MADPGYAPTGTPNATQTGAEAGAPPTYPDADAPGSGVNVPLLAVLLVILGLVSASNVWLRRRAEREGGETSEDEKD